MDEIKIKGQSIKAWIDWINVELTPPIKVLSSEKYVLEAFKESLELLNQKAKNE